MQDFIALANNLADEARIIVHQYFRKPFEVVSKDDASPVTVADRAIEKRLRAIIEEQRPKDGIFGEEFGIKESKSGYTWVIDPIDGTKSFVIGRATFGTLIALCKDDVPILGVIDQAIMKERWIGYEGKTFYSNDHLGGEFLNRSVKTRACASLDLACAGSTTPAMFDTPVYEPFDKSCKMMAWGGDCYMYGMLALGFMDLCLEASLSPYDFAALVPVVEGAGGKMRDWEGKSLTLKSDGRVLAVGDPALWDEATALLNG